MLVFVASLAVLQSEVSFESHPTPVADDILVSDHSSENLPVSSRFDTQSEISLQKGQKLDKIP